MQVNTLPAPPAPILSPDGSNPTSTQCASGQKLLLTYDSAVNVIVGGEAATRRCQCPRRGKSTRHCEWCRSTTGPTAN